MHRKALILSLAGVSAASVAAMAPSTVPVIRGGAPSPGPSGSLAQQYPTAQYPVAQPRPYAAPAANYDVARWNSLRQSDSLPFSSYASFLTSHRGWPGETALRKSAEKAIDSGSSSPAEVLAYFRIHPPLTPTGRAKRAFALLASGQPGEAREEARAAWHGGVLARPDEDRLLAMFGAGLGQADHDQRMDGLLDNGDVQSAQRTLPYTSAAQRSVYETRLALQTRAPDAASRAAMLGFSHQGHAGLMMDRANWLRNSGQSLAARQLLAQRPALTTRPANAEKWLETLLVIARAAANDSQWTTAYQIASRADDAFPVGTEMTDRSTGERDEYTSLVWLAGTTALQRLNRPSDAMTMFARYARGGKSLQVVTKGMYWAGRAALAANQPALANGYFEEAARYPELFYAQLSLERLGRPVPAPAIASPSLPSSADRAAFQRDDLAEAARTLGRTGAWRDQSLFVRALAERPERDSDRVLASDLALQLGRQDLNVWLARNARNSGSSFYVRSSYPEVRVPAAQSHYASLALGIMRQESSFDRAAISPVGARGMMQLMPGTAREVAGKMGLPYSPDRLTSDPAYNISLGSAYMASLMGTWGGNALLVAASYNAGSGNVRKWVREFGDPRLPGADIPRWIENIPFAETRGYVQRVLENAVVYDSMKPQGYAQRNPLSRYLGKNSPG